MDDRAAALALTPVSHETLQRLDQYVALLCKWQARTNLVALSTLPHLWTRHIADSMQLLRLAPEARTWLDIGSGGGFPGIVLACALADVPGAMVHLVERIAKKAAFLREALRITGGAGVVHHGDIVDCAADIPHHIDIVTARAVAPLSNLIEMAQPWLNHGSKSLFPKGLDVDIEMATVTKYSNFKVALYPSLTGNGQIVEIARHPHPGSL